MLNIWNYYLYLSLATLYSSWLKDLILIARYHTITATLLPLQNRDRSQPSVCLITARYCVITAKFVSDHSDTPVISKQRHHHLSPTNWYLIQCILLGSSVLFSSDLVFKAVTSHGSPFQGALDYKWDAQDYGVGNDCGFFFFSLVILFRFWQ